VRQARGHGAQRHQAHLLLRVLPHDLEALGHRAHERAQDPRAGGDHVPEPLGRQAVDPRVGERQARHGHGEVGHERLVAPAARRLEGQDVHPPAADLAGELHGAVEQDVEPERPHALLDERLACTEPQLLADEHVPGQQRVRHAVEQGQAGDAVAHDARIGGHGGSLPCRRAGRPAWPTASVCANGLAESPLAEAEAWAARERRGWRRTFDVLEDYLREEERR
jgi:hypothetical protein